MILFSANQERLYPVDYSIFSPRFSPRETASHNRLDFFVDLSVSLGWSRDRVKRLFVDVLSPQPTPVGIMDGSTRWKVLLA